MVDRGTARWQLGAALEAAGTNFEGDADDYVDGVLSASFDWQPLTRHSLRGGIAWASDHDPFGTRRTEALGTVNTGLDEWEQTGGNLVYRFGAPEATINLEGGVSRLDREYNTNRAFTQFLDHDITALSGTVFYRISSKTQLLAEVISADIDYDQVAPGAASRAGQAVRYRVGARWAATGNTVGDIRIGRIDRDFDSGVQSDYNEIDWKIGIDWSPRVRDKISFSTGREPEESYLNAARLIDVRYFGVSWHHDWSSKLRSTATYRLSELDFVGIARQDDMDLLSLELEYKPAPRWSAYAQIKNEERDSNGSLRDFDSTIFITGIRLAY